MRSPLKWVGGKRWLLPVMEEVFAPFKETHTWVDPFCGGLSLPLGLRPKLAVLSDMNTDLILFFETLRQSVKGERILKLSNSYPNTPEAYYEIRNKFNQLRREPYILDYTEYAAYFLYLNKTGYNGLYRVNKKGVFNVPCGRNIKRAMDCDIPEFRGITQFWQFHNVPAMDFLKRFPADGKWFIYCDPPYHETFTSYTRNGFSEEDQRNLAYALSGFRCPVVASNADTPFIRDLYENCGFTLHEVIATRAINCRAHLRKKGANELVMTKNI